MSREQATFDCPACESPDVYAVNGSDRFECRDCGQVTLKQVGKKRDMLETLAKTDLAIAKEAELLLRGQTEVQA
jgi:transposase-like protein